MNHLQIILILEDTNMKKKAAMDLMAALSLASSMTVFATPGALETKVMRVTTTPEPDFIVYHME